MTDESEITDKDNLDKSRIIDMESTDNGIDHDTSAPYTSEIGEGKRRNKFTEWHVAWLAE